MVIVMRYVKPHYYASFKCIADKCPDTCCAGWQIVIDEDTLEKYRDCACEGKDGFAEKLKASVDFEESTFINKGKRCAMLNDNNLCDLIMAKGEGFLCDTCNRYPRHIEEFDGVREYSLSLSCPVAADIMLKQKETTHFIVEEDETSDPLSEEFEDFDFMLYSLLEDAREEIFKVINNRAVPIEKRMAVLVKLAEEMQYCVDEGRIYDIQTLLDEIRENAVTANVFNLTEEERYNKLCDNFTIYTQMERLRDEWSSVLEGAWNTLYKDGFETYKAIYERFSQYEFTGEISTNEEENYSWDVFTEYILTFFIYTYFCGAVYDDCIYSKVVLSVMSACYIREFCMYKWYVSGKKITYDECIRMAYCYAREIEHSDLNLNALEDWIMDRL